MSAKTILMSAAGAAILAFSGGAPAAAAIALFDIDLANPTALGPAPYGTIKVEDFGTSTLEITVDLATGYALQNNGKNQTRESLSFNLSGNPSISYTFLTPPGGNLGGGSLFTGGNYVPNGYGGQGWTTELDYGVTVSDSNPPGEATGDLKFQITASSGLLTLASLTSESMDPDGLPGGFFDVFFTLDLNGTGAGFRTGPVGATLNCLGAGCGGGPGTVIPEPSTWALMIMGFGSAGAMLRRRRHAVA